MTDGVTCLHPRLPWVNPLPGWWPHRLDNGDWGSIYLGDTSMLPSELVGATISVQPREAGRASSPTLGSQQHLEPAPVRLGLQFLVARIVPRGHRLGLGNRFIFHQPDLIHQIPRQFHRFTCRDRLPKFILGFDREHRLAVSPFLADHGFPSVFSR